MSLAELDPRQFAHRLDGQRGGWADEQLRSLASDREAQDYRFLSNTRHRVIAGWIDVHTRPEPEAPLGSQFLYGDQLRLFADSGLAAGWCWVQNTRDGYVGYCQTDNALLPAGNATTNGRINVPMGLLFSQPDIKTPLKARIPLNSRLLIDQAWDRHRDFYRLVGGGFIPRHHAVFGDSLPSPLIPSLLRLGQGFVDSPYVWGGNSRAGLDCSGLVQMLFGAAGIDLPRDSDQQRHCGAPIDAGDRRAGDLVFWPGHVGVMFDRDQLLHAHAHAMRVTIEPLGDTLLRLADAGFAETEYRRIIAE